MSSSTNNISTHFHFILPSLFPVKISLQALQTKNCSKYHNTLTFFFYSSCISLFFFFIPPIMLVCSSQIIYILPKLSKSFPTSVLPAQNYKNSNQYQTTYTYNESCYAFLNSSASSTTVTLQ